MMKLNYDLFEARESTARLVASELRLGIYKGFEGHGFKRDVRRARVRSAQGCHTYLPR